MEDINYCTKEFDFTIRCGPSPLLLRIISIQLKKPVLSLIQQSKLFIRSVFVEVVSFYQWLLLLLLLLLAD